MQRHSKLRTGINFDDTALNPVVSITAVLMQHLPISVTSSQASG